MVESSAGKRLCSARLSRGLSIDEAAHATKMRPDKILALENDDYSRFASPSYAKGFLLIYSRFLGVDVSDQLREFDGLESRVNIDEYQYLSNAPEPTPVERAPIRRRDTRPSVVPLLIFVAVIAGGLFAGWVWMNFKRLPLNRPHAAVTATPTEASSRPTAAVERPAQPISETKTADFKPVDAETKPKVAPAPASEKVELRRLEPAPGEETIPSLTSPGRPHISQLDAGGGANKLIVETTRKTWVKIHRDSPDGPLIYEDYVYPGWHIARKLNGQRLYIEVRDKDAVHIRKDGLPIAYQDPGVFIQ
jgi:cytoskeleton protein RodZ